MGSQLQLQTPKGSYPTRPLVDNPLFVFLPGMDGTGKLLQTQTAGLEAGFNLRCLQIPPDDLTSWDELTHSVVTLIQAEIAQQRRAIYLCGESFGGCLALRVTLQAPHLIHRLILVNPASSFNRRPWIHWGSYLSRLLPEHLYQTSCVALLPFLASLGRIDASNRQALLNAMQSVTPEASIWRLSLLRQFDIMPEQLQQIIQPTLIVASGGDRLLPSTSEAEHLASHLPNTSIHALPDSGHACLLEADVNLHHILHQTGFIPQSQSYPPSATPATHHGSGRSRP